MNPTEQPRGSAPATMRAVTVPRYGGPAVLKLAELPVPEASQERLLVRVTHAAVNAADLRLMRADPWMVRLAFGLRAPRFTALGIAMAGTVVAGSAGDFAAGDRVMADLSAVGCSAFADYVSLAPEILVAIPDGLEQDAAATLPLAATTALQALRDHARLRAGQRVLITGASGAVGMAAVQIAGAMGAEVWAVTSTPKLHLPAQLGAARVLDRHVVDVIASPEVPRGAFDAIIDTAGYRRIFDWQPLLAPTGVYVHVGGAMRELARTALAGSVRSRAGGQSWKTFTANASSADLAQVGERAAAGTLTVPVGARFPLEDVRAAMEAAETGAPLGRVLIEMEQRR